MRQVIAFLNAALGAVAVIGGAAALIGLLGAMDRVGAEPEDVTSLALVTTLAVVVASAGLVNAWLLLRREPKPRHSMRRIGIGLSMLACLLLVVASIPGFNEDQPASVELKYLLIPAALVATGLYGLLRFPASEHQRA